MRCRASTRTTSRRVRKKLHVFGRLPRATLACVLAAAAGLSLPAGAAHARPAQPEVQRRAVAAAPRALQQGATLTKTGIDVQSGSTTTAGHGDTVRWVNSYTNPNPSDNLAAATINDPIQGAGTAQTYVPGSLQAPPGFTKQWSTDNGTTFTTTDPGTATNVVRATNPMLPSPATGVTTTLPAPFDQASFTGGDGYTPILYTATINGKPVREAWNIFHHNLADQGARVVCTDLDTGGPCPTPTGASTTWPKPLNSSTPGGTTGDVNNTVIPQYVLTGSRLLYPGTTDGSTSPAHIGVGCIDLQTQSSCGLTTLLSTSGAYTLSGLVSGPNGLVYGTATNGQILCEDPTTSTPCAGQPYSIGLPPSANFPVDDMFGTMDVINGHIYTTESPTGGSAVLACFDPATNTTCTGWSTYKTVATTSGSNNAFLFNLFTDYNTAGTAIGVCTIVGANSTSPTVTPAEGTVVCYDFSGNSIAAPAGLQTLITTNWPGSNAAISPTR